MSFRHLDQFAHVDSPLTRRSPTVRVAGTVIIAVGAAVLPLGAWTQLAVLGLLVAALAATAHVSPGAFLARFAPPFGFVLLASLGVLLVAPGETLVRLGPVGVTDAGALRFGSAVGRAAVALGAAVILVSTTSFPDLVRALRRLRLPTVVTTSLGLAYRFLYILNDEIRRLRRAARSRNAAAGAVPRRRLATGIAAAGLQRSFTRSERVHQAMLSRGYHGELPMLSSPVTAGRPRLELAALAAVVIAVVISAVP